jgi:S-adenosylmethionine/arginine decarboxylase-like enzyme
MALDIFTCGNKENALSAAKFIAKKLNAKKMVLKLIERG